MSRKKNPYDWRKLTNEEKDLYITILWRDGYSDAAIAAFLSATKGQAVGYRHKHLKEVHSGMSDRRAVKTRPISIDRFRELLAIDRMDDLRETGVAMLTGATDEFEVRNDAPKETVERAHEEGKVVPLRRRKKAPAKTQVQEPAPEPEARPTEPQAPVIGPEPVSEHSPEEVPREAPQQSPTSAPFKAEKVVPEEVVTKCQWPLSTGDSLNKPKLCGKPVKPGRKLCDEHFHRHPRRRP